uniref:VLRF1 domain-containing protein n=1 Tax=Compsopogon caeruleus TaxID=31354 RepID=A0A7S1XHH5_9RHOD|mmetsp:Transcript_9796/g.19952  ORF Transcript_9796/g.19952 Transcript_9796/m.19952 type:complete len:659 (+) Transcript_9796:1135-3111(+)
MFRARLVSSLDEEQVHRAQSLTRWFDSSMVSHAAESLSRTLRTSSPPRRSEEQGGTTWVAPAERSCLLCPKVGTFGSVREQRDHFGSDWHLYNLRQQRRSTPSVVACSALTEEEFRALDDRGEVSSISGSDDDTDDDDDSSEHDDPETRSDKFLAEEEGPERPRQGPRQEFGVVDTKEEEDERPNRPTEQAGRQGSSRGHAVSWRVWRSALIRSDDLTSAITLATCPVEVVIVMMFGGGHFAAAVWDATKPAQTPALAHKSIHRYTTRRKQGGSQTSNDRAVRARSAGASLRRSMEDRLKLEVQQTLKEWKEWFVRPSVVYIRATPHAVNDVFCGFDGSPVVKQSLRRIPFTTRRPTLAEVTRVLTELATVEEVEDDQTGRGTQDARKAAPSVLPDDCALRLSTSQIDLDAITRSDDIDKEAEHDKSSDAQQADMAFLFQSLCQGYKKAIVDLGPSRINLIFRGDQLRYKKGKVKVNGDGMTPLVIACVLGHHHLVQMLLEQGADPVLMKPYTRASEKETRDVFRRYWAHHPDQWDYSSGGIPSPLTPEMEARNAEKAQVQEQRRKNQKAKEIRALDEVTRPVEWSEGASTGPGPIRGAAIESNLLSDRERRALAAEFRAGTVCRWCYTSLRGKVPFERLQFKYCSTDCAHAHRTSQK